MLRNAADVALEMLAADVLLDETDNNIIVLRSWCPDDLQQASALGTCGPKLFTVIKLARMFLKADVQENEGANSLIRCITDRAKNIGLPLLCARTCIKKALGLGARGAPSQWSDRRLKLCYS